MQIDWWTLGLQTVNFLIVVWLLSRFLYRPIRKTIEDREAADRAAREEARKQVETAEETRRTYEAKLAEIGKAQQAREAEFSRAMQAERQKILDATRGETAAMIEKAREKIAQERREALENLRGEVLRLATDLARTSLAAPSGQADPVAQVTAYLDALDATALDDLRREATSGPEALSVVTATAPTETERAAWRAALDPRLGPGAGIGFATDPDILGGAELHLPHAALRFSVADRLNRAAAALET